MDKLIDINSYPVANVLDLLLQDKSTKKNIIWATDTYEEFGDCFSDKEQMDANSLLRRTDIIRPRIQKSLEAQAQRTRKKAEVFTPAWLCNRMNNHCDEDWFGRMGVFNTENEDHIWTVTEGKIEFPKRKKWQHYVDSRWLEITCGEAPYLVSRYDVSTGELIVPPIRRIGMLDRKLRIVNENTDTYDDWLKWTIRAFEACYGYEYQGDNVLIARINLLLAFVDYYEERWEKCPDEKLLRQIANKIAWNIWQMDGIKDTAPLGKPNDTFKQMTLFEMFGDIPERGEAKSETVSCRIFDWRRKASLKFMDLKGVCAMGKKLFDHVIGNPPYQDETLGDNATYAPPVYNLFMDAAYQVGEKVELIHPARFLFNAGSTPKEWNKKMLSDEHFKVLMFEQDSSKIFQNTDIKGGIAVTYRNEKANFGAIETFTPYDELNKMMKTISGRDDFKPFSTIVYSAYSNKFTKKLHEDFPKVVDIMSKGHAFDLKSNVFEKLPNVFVEEKPNNGETYCKFLGLINLKRVYRYINKQYINDTVNLEKYKVFMPAANGAGVLGEILAPSQVGEPFMGATESFISIGSFDTREEAEAALKYVNSKFTRVLFGILKITQHVTPEKWKYVPLQNFTSNSDIDWSKSIAEIDKQLYRKYGLTTEEIDFIETYVKEMV